MVGFLFSFFCYKHHKIEKKKNENEIKKKL